MSKTILVTGVTGKQGGAVARHLLKKGLQVKGLTRNPSSKAAKALAEMGVQLIQGDLENVETLKQAVMGCNGVFSVQNFWEKGVGYDGEIRQAKNLVEAARYAGVAHIVQSSIAGCDQAPGVKHFESKAVVEKIVGASGIPFTFLRTVMFMENFTENNSGKIFLPFLRGILPGDFKLHLITVDDIGASAAAAFDDAITYQNKTINLAGDIVCVKDIASIFEQATGRKAPRFIIPAWITGILIRDFRRQLTWNCGKNSNQGWRFSVNEMRAMIMETTTFKQFLQKQSNSVYRYQGNEQYAAVTKSVL